MEQQLTKILTAREERWNLRKRLAGECSGCVVTVSLCLPVIYRTSEEFLTLFQKMNEALKLFLHQWGIEADAVCSKNGADGPALFFTSSAPADFVKRACIQAEEELAGGRMLDIDIMAPDGKPIGRQDLGLAPRTCFVCGQPAHLCTAAARHTKEALAEQIERMAAAARHVQSGMPNGIIKAMEEV